MEAHPSWNKSSKGFLLLFDMFEMANDGADTWWEVSTKSEFCSSPGDYLINWKERGYGTILDILMVIKISLFESNFLLHFHDIFEIFFNKLKKIMQLNARFISNVQSNAKK